MQTRTRLKINDINIEIIKDITIVANSIKITNKRRTKAMQQKEAIENKIFTSIDKHNNKKAFYNKHKK